jgi:DNA-binding response OmpR family regulator
MSTQSARILVAHESETVRRTLERLVEDAGYEVRGAGDGDAALTLAAEFRPNVMVLDVALPGKLGYEVVERVRRLGLGARSILIASIYSRTGYKRRPTSLYGADDYIEQHHIPESLLLKIAKLLPEGAAPRVGPPDPKEGADIRREGEGRLQIQYETREEGCERAAHLARLIVSDIVLYNGAAVEEGLRLGDLEVRLRSDLEEGRLLFDVRVPEEIR